MTKAEATEKAKKLNSEYILDTVEDDVDFWAFSVTNQNGLVPPGLPELCIKKDTGELFNRIYVPSLDKTVLSPYKHE